jgi:hypothetical protein
VRMVLTAWVTRYCLSCSRSEWSRCVCVCVCVSSNKGVCLSAILSFLCPHSLSLSLSLSRSLFHAPSPRDKPEIMVGGRKENGSLYDTKSEMVSGGDSTHSITPCSCVCVHHYITHLGTLGPLDSLFTAQCIMMMTTHSLFILHSTIGVVLCVFCSVAVHKPSRCPFMGFVLHETS